MKSWETTGADRTYVCDVTPDYVSVGETRGNPHTDVHQTCSHAEFLEGRFQGIVAADHSDAVLEEVLAEIARLAAL